MRLIERNNIGNTNEADKPVVKKCQIQTNLFFVGTSHFETVQKLCRLFFNLRLDLSH